MDLAPYGAPVYGVEAAVAGTLLASLTLGLPLTVRAVGRPAVPSGSWPGWAASPGWWLAVVVTAIYLNQLLFTVHVIRVHGGDPYFVARYLPDGWFALADDNRVIAALAAAFPWPQVLAPSVLRVPAVLELPFVVLAYLCACRWWSPRLYQRLATPAVLGAACAVYTVTFCLIEWRFRNPYTWHDLPLRALSGVATAVAVSWLARATRAAGRAGEDHRSAVDLALFGMSAAALGQLVLVVYDTALLYNLGHAGDQVASAVAALAVLAAARWAARHRQQPGTTGGAGPAPGGVVDTVGAGIAWFAALLFVPAVPLRYAIGFAPPASPAPRRGFSPPARPATRRAGCWQRRSRSWPARWPRPP